MVLVDGDGDGRGDKDKVKKKRKKQRRRRREEEQKEEEREKQSKTGKYLLIHKRVIKHIMETVARMLTDTCISYSTYKHMFMFIL